MKSLGTYLSELKSAIRSLYTESEADFMLRCIKEDRFPSINLQDILGDQDIIWLQEAKAKILTEVPIQYVTGETFFYDQKFKVNPNVLIPRPETEELVHLVLSRHNRGTHLKVLDIGTGSGCIPVILKKKRQNWEVGAIDISEEALEVARGNATGLEINFKQLDFLDENLWSSLGMSDVIISNPPYIGKEENQRVSHQTLRHEPHLALFTETDDPLIFYRKIARFGADYLKSGGHIYMELNPFLAKETKSLFANPRYLPAELVQDLQGKDRILVVQKR